MGSTRSFRAYLAEYIREYTSTVFFFSDYEIRDCEIELRSDAKIIKRNTGVSGETANNNEPDNKLFDYQCYLCVNEFWKRFDKIRNTNHAKWPLIVDATDFLVADDYEQLILKSVESQRQVIIKR